MTSRLQRHNTYAKSPRPKTGKPKGYRSRLKQAKAAPKNPYKDDLIRIFLDDERPCPPGWILCRNVIEFETTLKHTPKGKLRAVSLDWYLGAGVIDGHEAAAMLASHLESDPSAFGELEHIFCHSSNPTEAGLMARTIVKVLRGYEDLYWVSVDSGLPWG